MSVFDGLETIPVAAAAKPAEQKKPSVFEGLNTLPVETTPAPEAEKPTENKAPQISDEEILTIAKKHNLSKDEAEELISVRGFLGNIGTTAEPKEMLKEAAGVASETFLFGLPQWIYKKAQSNPNMRAAIDDLNDEVAVRKSGLQIGTEIAGGFGGALKLGKIAKTAGIVGKTGPQQISKASQIARKLYEPAAAIASGATIGVTHSKSGDELGGAATGAAFGLGALAGGAAVSKAVPAVYKTVKDVWSNRLLREAVEEADRMAPQIEQRVDDLITTKAPEVEATKTALTDASTANNISEFLESTTPELRKKLVSQEEITRALRSESQVKALQSALGKDIITADDIIDSISYSKFSKAKTITEDLAGSNRSLSDIVKESPEFAGKVFERALRNEMAGEVITKLKVKDRLKEFSPIQRAAIFISDGKFVAKIFDDKLGTNMERVLDTGSKKLNLYTNIIQKPLKQTLELAENLRKSGIKSEDLYAELESKTVNSAVGKQAAQFFEQMRQLAGEAGIQVAKLEGYVPHLRKPIAEYMFAFKQQLKNINPEQLFKLKPSEFKEALSQNQVAKELVGELEQLGAAPIKDGDDFKFTLQRFLNNPAELRAGLNASSFATRQRLGGIPDWALDKNVPRLASRWVQNTFRYGAIRETVLELKSIAKIADQAGQDDIALHTRNLIADLLGTRTKTFASQQKQLAEKFQIFAVRKSEEATDPFAKVMWNNAYDALDIISKSQQQVYPNYLGLNPKSALQNLTSAVFQNAPELGKVLGPKYIMSSYADMAAYFAKNGDFSKLLYANGILPRQWTAEMVEALREGARSNSALGDISRKALDKYTGAMMYLFTKSEIFARTQTYFIGKRMAADMLKNPKIANTVMARISSSSYRNLFRKMLNEGNAEGLQKAAIDYLQSTNMFNYDRLNMSDYGRTMGPLFSVFSKWPTATAGKLAHYYINGPSKEAIVRSMQTLAVPYFGMMLIDNLLAPEPGESDIYDKLVGKKGLKGWTMADAIPTDVGIREGLMSTPILSAGADLVDAAKEPKPGKALVKWLDNSIKSFMPGAGAVRFFMEDLPLYQTGQKQDKFNFLRPNTPAK